MDASELVTQDAPRRVATLPHATAPAHEAGLPREAALPREAVSAGEATPSVEAASPVDAVLPGPVPELYADFAAAPWDWDFYQALRRLEAAHPDRPRIGRSVRPAQDAIRLAQIPTVGFAPATLAGWDGEQDGNPARLLVHFLGLFGPDGPLPLHLTEYARDRTRNFRDSSFQHFADIFHHRALSLFYRAWANSRPTVSFDRPEDDRFALYVGSLIGLGMDSLRDRDAMPDLTKLHFAGHLACQTRHAEGLSSILSEFFHVPVRVECFVGAWLALPDADRTRLGQSPRTAALGHTALLGGRVWSRQHKFRIVIGPLDLIDYRRLLPGGLSFHRLIPIVRNYVGDTLIWDVNLILRREQVPSICLGRQGQLGWTTWLTPRNASTDAADLFLDASADSMAARIDHGTPSFATDHSAANLEPAL
ncbi:MAG TPA: type VI secretion system baseplate subunit TssG [Acetobacteraceae bacterium]|jgi:type VI secretion system protein ImpH|nr:type VI secretion system baseplate subunit TssG [Acetobacteraceae bacterium]